MKFECPTCKLSGKIDDEKLAGQSIYANCPKCKTRFLINDNIKFDIEVETASVKPTDFSCPKCGHKQLNDLICDSCGIVFNKYKPESQSPLNTPQLKLMSLEDAAKLIGNQDFMDVCYKNVFAYIKGVKEFDSKMYNSSNEIDPERVMKLSSITFRDRGILLSIFSLHYTAIKFTDISKVEIQQINLASVKDKSVVGRAIVGGLVLGPLGAIVGGISGVGTVKIQYDYLISITYTSPSKNEGSIVFIGQKNDCNVVINKFKEQLGSKITMISG